MEKNMSWMNDNTGRPKEEGGHKPKNLSLCASIRLYLDSKEFISLDRLGVKNQSQFVEKAIREFVKRNSKQKALEKRNSNY